MKSKKGERRSKQRLCEKPPEQVGEPPSGKMTPFSDEAAGPPSPASSDSFGPLFSQQLAGALERARVSVRKGSSILVSQQQEQEEEAEETPISFQLPHGHGHSLV